MNTILFLVNQQFLQQTHQICIRILLQIAKFCNTIDMHSKIPGGKYLPLIINKKHVKNYKSTYKSYCVLYLLQKFNLKLSLIITKISYKAYCYKTGKSTKYGTILNHDITYNIFIRNAIKQYSYAILQHAFKETKYFCYKCYNFNEKGTLLNNNDFNSVIIPTECSICGTEAIDILCGRYKLTEHANILMMIKIFNKVENIYDNLKI